MPVNFPNSPSNDDEHSANGLVYKYNSTKGAWKRKFVAPTDATDINQLNDSSGLLTSSSTTIVADMAALIALTGMSSGDQAYITANNKLYFYNGSGWYLIATVQNDAPSAITGVNGSYELAIDGTATTITAASTDPEGFPLTWSYSTSGLGSIATVSNTDNVFTITPSTTEADAGTFTLTINATDGINGAVNTSTSLTLEFIVTVTNSNYTTLLATAVDTSDNNNITDASTNTHSITVNGDAYAGTFSPYRSGGYSTKFDPNSYFSILNQPAIGSGDCSIECWVNVATFSRWHGIIKRGANSTTGAFQFYVRNDTELFLDWNGTEYTTSGANIQTNTWHWLQIIRSSGTVTIYVDGVSRASFNDDSNIQSTTFYEIGGWTGNFSEGFIRDLRVSTVARSSSTGPSDKLEVDSDTTFLTCNSPYVTFSTPSAVNNYLQYISGPVSTKPFSPYDYNEYSATVHGGSVYFGGGTREHLSTSLPAFGTQDFEVEFWIYGGALTSNTWYTLFSRDYNVNGSFRIYASGNSGEPDKFIYIANGTEYNYTSAGKIKDNVWNHILLSRVSGTAKWFINGIEDTSWSDSENMTSTATLYIGDTGADETSSSSYPFVGYMSDIAIRMGGSGYRTSAFTPPTAPLSSTGAELHIKGTDASIIDKSQGSNLKLEGSTTGSTTQVKFANTKSMKFDSLDDKISVSGVLDLSQACTWEAWVYFDNHPDASGFMHMFQSASYSSTNPPFGIRFKTTGSAKINFVLHTTSGDHEEQTASGVALDTWHHLAFSRTSSGVYNIYLNGTRYATFTESATYQSAGGVMVIGNSGTGSTTARHLDGYMQDIRITQGLARYTAADETSNIPSAPLEG